MLQALLPPDPPAQVIVVTGKALDDPATSQAYDVVTLDSRDLAEAPSHRLDEILQQVPGLQLFRRSDSTSGHPTSQGVTLRSLGGNATSRALLVLDGVPQADPFGGWVNWPAYDPAGLGEISVVRGGGSVVHGPGALAGVIAMTSRSDERVGGSLDVGSKASAVGVADLGTRLGGGLFTIHARASRSEGFVPLTRDTRGPIDEPAPYREASIRSRYIAPLSPLVDLQASLLMFADERERGVPFTANSTSGADGSLRLVGRGAWQWTVTGYGQLRAFTSSFASVNDDRTEANRVAFQDSVPSHGWGGSAELRPPMSGGIQLRLGADARVLGGETRELYSYSAGVPLRRRAAGGDTATVGAYGEIDWSGGRLTLTAGARLDHWRISDGKLVERLLSSDVPSRDDHFDPRSGLRPTARLAALLDLGGGLSLRGAAYTGWRLPTLNELFRPFRAGPDATAANASLKPERLRGAEAGVRYSRPALDLSLTGFANRLSDAVANVTLGRGPGTFPGIGFVAGDYRQRLNIGAVQVTGFEASGEVRLAPWSLQLAASYSDAEMMADGSAAALNGLRPAQTPLLIVTGELGWRNGPAAASLEVKRVGNQYEDDLNRVRLPAATVVGAFASWSFSRRMTLVARAENLFDATVLAGVDETTAERATPRTLWIGLRFSAD